LVRAGHLTLWPKIQTDGVVMGSVLVPSSDPVRRFLIGMAPAIVGIGTLLGGLWISQLYGLWGSPFWDIIIAYAVFEIGNTLFLSRSDRQGMLGLLIVVAILLGLIYAAGFRPTLAQSTTFLDRYDALLSPAVWLLWIPLIIDGAGILILGSIRAMRRIF
jgi:hypothetical protein